MAGRSAFERTAYTATDCDRCPKSVALEHNSNVRTHDATPTWVSSLHGFECSGDRVLYSMLGESAGFLMDIECYPRVSPPFSSDESQMPGRRRLAPLWCSGQSPCWSVGLGSVVVGGGVPVCGMGPTRRAESCQGDAATCADVVMIQEMIQ